jgi:hypothetical protein
MIYKSKKKKNTYDRRSSRASAHVSLIPALLVLVVVVAVGCKKNISIVYRGNFKKPTRRSGRSGRSRSRSRHRSKKIYYFKKISIVYKKSNQKKRTGCRSPACRGLRVVDIV